MKFGSKTYGLGDTLTLTSVCKYFPNRFTVQLPKSKERFKILFSGLAQVEICEESEIIPLPDIGGGHYATRKLRNFFGEAADGMNNRPLVLHCNENDEKWAYEFLKKTGPAAIFVPNCSKQWSGVRSMPQKAIDYAINQIKSTGSTPIVCQSSLNKIETKEIELVDLDLSKYISLLRQAGGYCGANTGDEHLAAALGCMTYVFQPKDGNGFFSSEWNYDHPCSTYYVWDDSVLDQK